MRAPSALGIVDRAGMQEGFDEPILVVGELDAATGMPPPAFLLLAHAV
jgi:hypothetical protein